VILLENDTISIEEFLPKIHTILLELYLAGHNLEEIELKYSSENTDFDRDIFIENKNVGLISKLGEDTFYLEIFDPTYEEEKEGVQGWLVDDFSDIYGDLKTELIKIDTIKTNESIEDALWTLKWGFSHHWGTHCINALRYLHFLY